MAPCCFPWMLALTLLHSLLCAADTLFPGAINICNTNLSRTDCDQRTSSSTYAQYECTKLHESSAQRTICGCSSSIAASVIIIIDASNHTRDEWQYLTLRWLEMYYNAIYSAHPHNMQVYYMLSHGDFTLTALNGNPSQSELASPQFLNGLSSLSRPNACVAFKRANEWLKTRQQTDNDVAIIFSAKTTPFAPSFLYHCRKEHGEYDLIQSQDIFAIKFHDAANLNYVQRDIGEFASAITVFPFETTHNDEAVTLTASNQDYLEYNKSEEIASSIVAAISDFVCAKGREEVSPSTSITVISPRQQWLYEESTDCCSHVSGVEYSEMGTCNASIIEEIEYNLDRHDCIYYCDPFHYYLPINVRNWQCIENYALWVQYYYICESQGDEVSANTINETLWNEYKWHCPRCFNTSVDEYKSVCTSVDGQDILDAYVAENCDCKDVTLFLVVIIEIIALLCILIGMLVLWFRFNVWKIRQHLREKQMMVANALREEEEIVHLNDVTEEEEP